MYQCKQLRKLEFLDKRAFVPDHASNALFLCCDLPDSKKRLARSSCIYYAWDPLQFFSRSVLICDYFEVSYHYLDKHAPAFSS